MVADDQGGVLRGGSRAPGAAAELWSQARDRREESYLAETGTPTQQRDEADLAGGGYEQVALDLIAALAVW